MTRIYVASIVLTVLFLSVQTKSQGFKGLVPLESDCDDVKRVLSVKECDTSQSVYLLGDYWVTINFYNKDGEKKNGLCYRVPTGRIESITVSYETRIPLNDFEYTLSNPEGPSGDIGTITYSNYDMGVVAYTQAGMISSASFIPTRSQNEKFAYRCQQSQRKLQAAPERSITVRGQVVDSADRPIERAYVCLHPPECADCVSGDIVPCMRTEAGLFSLSAKASGPERAFLLYIESDVPSGHFNFFRDPANQLRYRTPFIPVEANKKFAMIDLGKVRPKITFDPVAADLRRQARCVGADWKKDRLSFSISDQNGEFVSPPRRIESAFWKDEYTVNLAVPTGIWSIAVADRPDCPGYLLKEYN